MEHPAELSVYSFLAKAMAGEASVSKDIMDQVATDVSNALDKQFNGKPRDEFKLRMSNVGRPKCQLWFEKNDPKDKTPFPPHFLMNMLLGDIVEAVFKGLLRASGVQFEDNDNVTLKLGDGKEIQGEYDLVLDGKVDDIKSASPWSYNNKFVNLETLQQGDSFGYIPQLVGYAKGADKDVGGWWVVNKGTGQFKYVNASTVNTEEVINNIEDTYDYLDKDEPFERCYEAVNETFYKKATGNKKLCTECSFCSYKHKCWPTLKTQPSLVSTAREKPMIDYVQIGKEVA
tara:strand:- start:171 stop:1031 length:861 start_codon:yes stop_codon:yes gene_type:complete